MPAVCVSFLRAVSSMGASPLVGRRQSGQEIGILPLDVIDARGTALRRFARCAAKACGEKTEDIGCAGCAGSLLMRACQGVGGGLACLVADRRQQGAID